MKRATVTAIFAVLLFGFGQPPMTLASHSAPAPLHFWDPNNDSFLGPEPAVDPSGSLWTSALLARLNGAVAEWSTDTSFDMTVVGTGEQDAYVDGRDPPCISGTGYEVGGGIVIGVVCRKEDAKLYPGSSIGYYDIYDFDMYFYMNTGATSEPDWWVGTTLTPDAERLHFQGVATHELGHWIRLIDLAPSGCTYTSTGMYTMCGTSGSLAQARLDTWRQSTLHADDIAAANVIY